MISEYKNKPLVSVVMPVYNSEEYLRRAMESVFKQSYKNYEFIIIDDGSTDTSLDIINEYKDKIIYFYQDNSGVSAARNKGIGLSKGELIAFLDSDDLWYPEKLQVQVDAYLKEPEAALIHTEVDKQPDFKGYIKIRPDALQARHKSFIEVFKATNLKTPSVMIPKKVLNSIGLFDEALPTAEDKDLFLRCCYNNLVLYIPQELVYCSVFPGSLCDELRSYQDNIDVIDRFIQRAPEFLNKNKDLVNEAKSKIYCEYADDLCFKNKCSDSIKAGLKSMSYRFNVAALKLCFKALFKSCLFLCKVEKVSS